MVFFHFYSNFNRTFCKQIIDPDQMLHTVASDPGLHCLHMSYKKDAMPIWFEVSSHSYIN